ncbi:MAG: hypothetical protein U5L05_02890 [Rubrivivax sp.]|nr:hypothetical protein [Rubrivivax sp.]
MSGLPAELIFLLIVGLVGLAQFVRRQRRRQTMADSEVERGAEAVAEAENPPSSAVRLPALRPNLAEGPRRAPPPRDRRALAPAASAPAGTRRYSRSVLMGNRHAVQNAMVTAAVLQPCRAHRPYGTD